MSLRSHTLAQLPWLSSPTAGKKPTGQGHSSWSRGRAAWSCYGRAEPGESAARW